MSVVRPARPPRPGGAALFPKSVTLPCQQIAPVMSSNRFIYIIMAVHEPDPELLTGQIQSILQQNHDSFRLLLVPDGPQPGLVEILGQFDDSRISLHTQEAHAGITRNFERGLDIACEMSTQPDDLFAYCDQDDIWEYNKLKKQVTALEASGAVLCHHDASVIDAQGNRLHDSLFTHENRKQNPSFLELLTANTVTGMTMLFTKPVAEATRSFPLGAGMNMQHDWWTALVSGALGPVVFLNEKLVQYRQHGRNAIGAGGQGTKRRAATRKARKPFVATCLALYQGRKQAITRLNMAVPIQQQVMPGPFEFLLRGLVWRFQGQRQRAKHALFIALGAAFSHLPFLSAGRNGAPGAAEGGPRV